RNRTVHATTHRNRDPALKAWSPKNGPDRIGQRISSKLLPTNGSGLEQCQPDKRPLEPSRVSLNDPLTVKTQPNKSKVSPTRRIPNQLNHGTRLAAIAASGRSTGAPSDRLESKRSHHGPAKRSRTSFRPNPAVTAPA